MEMVMITLFQLAFVAVVYSAAYRQGFDASRRRTEAIVEEFSYPVAELLAKLEAEIEKDEKDPSRDPNHTPED